MTSLFRSCYQKYVLFKKRAVSFFRAEVIMSSSIWTLFLIFCCLVFTTFISYRATLGLIEDNILVLHSQEVIEQVLEVSTNIRAAEGRQRGFLLTRDPEYLDRFEKTLLTTDNHLLKLQKLVSDNPGQLIKIQKLKELFEKRKINMREVVDVYQNKGEEEGRKFLILGGGLAMMREISLLAENIQETEKLLLKARTENSSESRDYALKGLVIGALFTTALVLFAYFLLVNDLRRRQEFEKSEANARDNLEQKVLERTQELEQSNRELQEFAYVASHDLQEPLRKIQVFGDRLKQKAADNLDESSLDYLERMQSAAKRMQKLINDLLQFSRVSNQDTTDNVAPIDFNVILQEVLSDLEGSIEHYQGQVCIDNLPTIKADPLQIRQLLQNIISNALKFHRPDALPEISVVWYNQASFTDPGDQQKFYEIAVIDNGIGIDPQYVDKIFVPFQRLHGKAEYEGTGIGLAVCRKIIEKLHGYIRVLPSPEGKGTMFVLGFPSI